MARPYESEPTPELEADAINGLRAAQTELGNALLELAEFESPARAAKETKRAVRELTRAIVKLEELEARRKEGRAA